MDQPQFPISIHWLETGEVEEFDSLREVECNVEEFDSTRQEADVRDALGRRVKLKIALLDAVVFELYGNEK